MYKTALMSCIQRYENEKNKKETIKEKYLEERFGLRYKELMKIIDKEEERTREEPETSWYEVERRNLIDTMYKLALMLTPQKAEKYLDNIYKIVSGREILEEIYGTQSVGEQVTHYTVNVIEKLKEVGDIISIEELIYNYIHAVSFTIMILGKDGFMW